MEVPHPKMSFTKLMFSEALPHERTYISNRCSEICAGSREVVHKQDELISKELTVAIAR